MLDTVFRSGAITITAVEQDKDMEKRLRNGFKKLHMKKYFVAKTSITNNAFLRPVYTEIVAHLSLKPLLNALQNAQSLGIIGGEVIARWIELLPVGSLSSKDIYSLMTTKSWSDAARFATTPNSLLSRIAYKNPDVNPHPLPFINLDRRTAGYVNNGGAVEKKELSLVNSRRLRAANVDVAVLSVNKYDYAEARYNPRNMDMLKLLDQMEQIHRSQIVGELLLRLLESHGNRVGTQEDQNLSDAMVYSIDLEDLQRLASADDKQVWLINGNPAVAKLVHAVIKGEYVNCLVTTSQLAEELLRL
ncbi:MAG: hypothetical protein IPK52_19655 [Chloroflexi bacterium]|nr:hypothetical protein [Chloroflexota bacterium]